MCWYQSLHILEAMKCTQDLCGTPSVYGNGQENKHLCHKPDNVCGFTSVRWKTSGDQHDSTGVLCPWVALQGMPLGVLLKPLHRALPAPRGPLAL